MVIGHLFLMNLFLAILLKNFETDSENDEESSEDSNLNSNKIIKYINHIRTKYNISKNNSFCGIWKFE